MVAAYIGYYEISKSRKCTYPVHIWEIETGFEDPHLIVVVWKYEEGNLSSALCYQFVHFPLHAWHALFEQLHSLTFGGEILAWHVCLI